MFVTVHYSLYLYTVQSNNVHFSILHRQTYVKNCFTTLHSKAAMTCCPHTCIQVRVLKTCVSATAVTMFAYATQYQSSHVSVHMLGEHQGTGDPTSSVVCSL